ncbi:hypothetical protein ASF10_19075 [Flavobacterium sp. Leaf82]|uniref:hypothetical protein n=1 Tax=unclassified Flavobacterium TaxID=196869 RepID=UPI0006F2D645|nr:hypothetical protein [Flavobacterium sp. Leaf82]KQO33178.1 hypothetical protein ASF10_19075 [Flavobacterium sp. Leaf82]
MTENRTQLTHFLETAGKKHYFTKLQPDDTIDTSFTASFKIETYTDLMLTITSLIRTSIAILRNEEYNSGPDAALLLEMAKKLLPDDEMELLDELYSIL